MDLVCWDTSWFVLPTTGIVLVPSACSCACCPRNRGPNNFQCDDHPRFRSRHAIPIPCARPRSAPAPPLPTCWWCSGDCPPRACTAYAHRAAYRLALELGADVVEPDLGPHAGRAALHTLDLNVTTDVVTKFGNTRQPWFPPTAHYGPSTLPGQKCRL